MMQRVYVDIWARGGRVEDPTAAPVVKVEYTMLSNGRVHLLRYDCYEEPGAVYENRILEVGERFPVGELAWILLEGCPQEVVNAISVAGGKIRFDGRDKPLEPGALQHD